MSKFSLRRSVPFVSPSFAGNNLAKSTSKVVLIDRVEIPFDQFISTDIRLKLNNNLSFPRDSLVKSESAINIVREQLDAGLEIAFSDPYWQEIRSGDPEKRVTAYILETYHYLAAAPYRMASGVGNALIQDPIIDNIASHMIEEAGHKVYFSNALNHIGCSDDMFEHVYPLPTTIELIYLMRAVSRLGNLSAALCSGLMEHSTENRSSVDGWHKMLIDDNILPESAVTAMYGHTKIDRKLGHGSNWRKILSLKKFVEPKQLIQALNALTLVAEMLLRWTASLRTGLSRDLVYLIPYLEGGVRKYNISRDTFSDGLPVLSSELLHHAVHGGLKNDGARKVAALAIGYRGLLRVGPKMQKEAKAFLQKSNELVTNVSRESRVPSNANVDDVITEIHNWLRLIDGHHLWKEMLEAPNYHFILGWLLENFHYLGFIAQHNSAAISACTDSKLRDHLVHHLKEELNHAEILRRAIETSTYPYILQSRPLATTVAFLGSLRDLAQQDWKAYCIAMSFLQFTISPSKEMMRHNLFYDEIIAKCPSCTPLLNAMRQHERIDDDLEHNNDMRDLLVNLVDRHHIGRDTLGAAAIVAQLTWSFLDGIRCHYQEGEVAILTRMGWSLTSSMTT